MDRINMGKKPLTENKPIPILPTRASVDRFAQLMLAENKASDATSQKPKLESKASYAPLNRTIDVSIDVHNTKKEMSVVQDIIREFPEINFTVYTYEGVSVKGAVAGFHINPVDDSEATMLKKIDVMSSGMPVSIHGSATNRLPASVMSALKDKGVPFVRLASPKGATEGDEDSPPLVSTFDSGSKITTIQNKESVNHYFFHTHELSKSREALNYLSDNAK